MNFPSSFKPFMAPELDVCSTRQTGCEICGSSDTHMIFRQENVPVFCNVLYDADEKAKNASTGKIHLVQCRDCGYIFNNQFDEEKIKYQPEYENPLHHSTIFREYADELAEMLVDNFKLKSKRILEIGCGDGDFLKRLKKRGVGECVGIDPSCPDTNDENIKLVRKLFDPKKVKCNYDLICMRHVLEHISEPKGFLESLSQSMVRSGGGSLFIEVPAGEACFDREMIWDILYEHKSYFTAPALDYLLKSSGFDVTASWFSFGGQFVCFVARPQMEFLPRNFGTKHSVFDKFKSRYQTRLIIYHHCMRLFRKYRQKVVVWGGGTKGINFVNAMGRENTAISSIVDINRNKQGKFIPISGTQIVSADSLKNDPPDVVIVMNENYKVEIMNKLNNLGIKASILLA